jgi:hypothetical protein
MASFPCEVQGRQLKMRYSDVVTAERYGGMEDGVMGV